MIKIVIADDEPLALQELQSLIRSNGSDFKIIGEFRNGRKVLNFLLTHPETDLAILDINMPGISGLEIMEQLNLQSTEIDFIVVSAYSDYHLVRRAFKLGITDFIIKQELEKESLNPLLERVKEKIIRRKKRSNTHLTISENRGGKDLLRFLRTGEKTGGLSLPWVKKGPSRLLKMEILPCIKSEGEIQADAMLRLLYDKVSFSFSEYAGIWDGKDLFLIIVSLSDEEEEKLTEFSEDFRRHVRQYFNCTLVITPSPAAMSLEEIPALYRKMKETHSVKSKTIRGSMEYIRHYYQEPEICLDDLCKITATSRSYLSSLFKQETGIGFREYLNEVRIGNSITLLEKGEIQIQTIAEMVGFSNVEHFSRTFKNRTGISPRTFQRGK